MFKKMGGTCYACTHCSTLSGAIVDFFRFEFCFLGGPTVCPDFGVPVSFPSLKPIKQGHGKTSKNANNFLFLFGFLFGPVWRALRKVVRRTLHVRKVAFWKSEHPDLDHLECGLMSIPECTAQAQRKKKRARWPDVEVPSLQHDPRPFVFRLRIRETLWQQAFVEPLGLQTAGVLHYVATLQRITSALSISWCFSSGSAHLYLIFKPPFKQRGFYEPRFFLPSRQGGVFLGSPRLAPRNEFINRELVQICLFTLGEFTPTAFQLTHSAFRG